MSVDDAVVEVSPGIWRTSTWVISGRYRLDTNAYLIVDDGAAMFVDTAWWRDDDSDHLARVFEHAGIERSQVQTVLITHAHRDHAGFGEKLRSWTGASVLLHEDEQPTVGSLSGYQGLPDEDAAARWYRSHGFPEEAARRIVRGKLTDRELDSQHVRWVKDGDVVRVGRRAFTVLATPGHTPGHICVFEPSTGILFSGDALLPRGHGNPHVTVRAFTPPDPLSDYVRGIERLEAMQEKFRVCLPGHGPVVDDPAALIRTHLDYVEMKLESARAVLDDTPLSAYQAVGRMPWRGGRATFAELEGDELFLAFADGLARLRRLVSLGRARGDVTAAGERFTLAS